MNGNRSMAILCLLVGGLCGCETSKVAEQDPPTPTAPAAPQSATRAPGPQDPDAPQEFTATDSGLKYRILRKGTGRKPTSADSVTVHYKGWLDDETVFDSSYERGEPITFELLGVIKGWTEGLQHVNEGGMIELEIPSELGYGARGAGSDIPPNATLHFIVELIEVR
jgi:FKBP-type peptidyl-prolyl cis-trans isomerase